MGWIYLILAGCCEVVYAAIMPLTYGFSKPLPSIICISFIGASMYLLSKAVITVPIGTAYAVWVGIGAVGVAVYGILFRGEDYSFLRILCFIFIVAGIVGLKLLSKD